MTVNTTTSRADYTGNGVTTAFTVPFYFLDNTHLTVLRTVIATGVSTTLALGTDYSVTGAGVPAGGTVTCTVAPTAAQKISILRNVPFTQLTDYVPNDPFPAESHERALDQLTMLAQQVTENVSRAITLPAATTGISTNLPTAQPLQLLGFNAAGNALTTYDPTSLLTVAGSSGFSTQTFNGTGAQTAFTLSEAPGAITNLEVFISGVRQQPTTDYTLSGSTLTFVSGAPAAGTGNIFVRWGTTLGIGVPSDTSVTTAKIADANVTTAKIADANVTTAKIAFNPLLNNFRLTPTSGVPVVTGDANAVTTLYMTPYNGNQIALYNGSRWDVRSTAEISISLASTTAGLGYDVFCYDNSGTPTLELTAWTNSTTRATALVYQNGVLVKSGATTRRYLGSFYCHTNGQTASSLTNTGATTGRYIYNHYNRVLLRMQRFESTASWAYTGGYRQANGSTVNQLNFFIGVVEDAVACSQTGLANINSANSGALTAIGLNSTTSPLNGSVAFLNSQIINYATYASSTINATPTLGLNYLSWMEYGNAAGCTFFGSTYGQGINGAILC